MTDMTQIELFYSEALTALQELPLHGRFIAGWESVNPNVVRITHVPASEPAYLIDGKLVPKALVDYRTDIWEKENEKNPHSLTNPFNV